MSFIACPSSASGRGVGQQRHLAGVLDRLGDLALLLGADAGDAAGADLAAVGDELAQQVGVLVVDVVDLGRERAGSTSSSACESGGLGMCRMSPSDRSVNRGLLSGLRRGVRRRSRRRRRGRGRAPRVVGGALPPPPPPLGPPEAPKPPPEDEPRWVRLTLAVAYFSDGPTSSTSSSTTVRFSPSRVSNLRCLSRPWATTRMPRVQRLGDVLGRLAPDASSAGTAPRRPSTRSCCGRTCAAWRRW